MISLRRNTTGTARRSRHTSRRHPSMSNICAKLVTERNGRREVIVLGLNKPVIVGRNPEICTYVISDLSVSGVHCKISAVRSPNGGVIVSCQDLSKNGVILNENRIRKGLVILMDGDVLRIPDSLSFTCMHIWKQARDKAHIFDQTPPQQPALKEIGKYVVTSQCLGSGSFATVNLALDIPNRRQIACKTIRMKKAHETETVLKEVKILKKLDHPNINRIYDYEVDGKFIHIFLQLCSGGDLFTYITSHVDTHCCLYESEAKYIMFQLLKAIRYIHNQCISHRDLKPENILLHGPGPYPRILIADFGLARPKSWQETFTVCGTVSYLPPEGIRALEAHKSQKIGYVGMPSDCWSAGVILYIMLSGSHPFDFPGENSLRSSENWLSHIQDSHDLNSSQVSQNYMREEARLRQRIMEGEVDFQRPPWDRLHDAKKLIGRLLVHDPKHRATVYTALISDWITSELGNLQTAYDQRIIDLLPPDERPLRRC